MKKKAKSTHQQLLEKVAEEALRYRVVHGIEIYVQDSYDAGYALSKALDKLKKTK